MKTIIKTVAATVLITAASFAQAQNGAFFQSQVVPNHFNDPTWKGHIVPHEEANQMPMPPTTDTCQTQTKTPIQTLSKSPIKILRQATWFEEGINLEILSLVDCVEVQSVIVNRGNCKLMNINSDENGNVYEVYDTVGNRLPFGVEHRFPSHQGRKTKKELESEGWKEWPLGPTIYRKPSATLKYGEVVKLAVTCNEILEVVVKTNLGEFKLGN